MTYFPKITLGDGPQLDAFGKLRVSQGNQLLDSKFIFDKLPLIWDESATGGASAATLNADSTITLATTATSHSVIRQTKRYYIYRSGQSQMVVCSFQNILPETNITKRVGYFDANDGIFLESASGVVNIVRRSSTSTGTSSVVQSSWNIDKFDGTGPSGITLDWSKAQILIIDLQWLGVGRVRVGFEIDGVLFLAHEFLHSNSVSTTYMKTASLPVRYEISQSGSGSGSLLQICSSVSREGAGEALGIVSAAYTAAAGATMTTSPQTLLSIRLRSSYNRAFIDPLQSTVFNLGNNNVRWRLILNPTVTGSHSWSNIAKTAEQSLAVLAYTEGTGQIITGGYANGSGSRIPDNKTVNSIIGISSNIAGTSDILSIVATAIGGSQATGAILTFKEIF